MSLTKGPSAADIRFDVSVVMPTFNRCALLRGAVDSVLDQRTQRSYELIVVDNNSTDDTQVTVDALAREASRPLRRVLECQQGVSYARNAGIRAARAPIVAFVDDDVRVEPSWIETISQVFAGDPRRSCIGGKVLPLWAVPPPAWLTAQHWAPIALLDFGDTRVVLNQSDKRCLLTANMACRREVFDKVGFFRPEFQRVRDAIGSMEDFDWLLRFWETGGEVLYVPELRAWAEVPESRMTRAYHRRWHSGHGHFYALINDPDFERSRRRVLGVPGHAYRAALRDAWLWLNRMLRRDTAGAFIFETRLRFFASFFYTRAWSGPPRRPAPQPLPASR